MTKPLMTLEEVEKLRKEILEKRAKDRAEKLLFVRNMLEEQTHTYAEIALAVREANLVEEDQNDTNLRQAIATYKTKLSKEGVVVSVVRAEITERSRPIPTADRVLEAFKSGRLKEVTAEGLSEMEALLDAEIKRRKEKGIMPDESSSK